MACSGCAARREWIKKWSKIAYDRSIDLLAGKDGGRSREPGPVDEQDRRANRPADPGDDKPFALAAQANAVEYARQNGVRIFYWSAGLWWPEGNETAIEVGGKIRAQWPAINSAAGRLLKDGPD